MQLSITTDYAVRVLLFLAMFPPKRTASEISAQMGVSRAVTMKILQSLRANGWVEMLKSEKGEYRLKVDPEDIDLLKIIVAMEGTIKINRCLEEDQYCTRFATQTCPVRKNYAQIQNTIERALSAVTLQDLVDQAVGVPEQMG